MHFYESKGGEIIPRHFVPTASRPGETRPTRISDARKYGWFASVTTIQGMLDKPGLNNWRIDEHLKAVFELGSLEGFSELDDFITFVKRKTQEALDKAPQQGSDIHQSIEDALRGGLAKDEHRIAVSNAITLAEQKTGAPQSTFIVEKSFAHEMGYAGKVDVHILGGEPWVLDWKSKNSADKWKPGKMAYPEMCQQLAAYRVGLGLHNARCANVFVCIPTGEVEFHEWGPNDIDREFANFSDLLRIWLRNAMYIPGRP